MTDEEAGVIRAEIKDARQNLLGALIDIERAHGYADAVCIDTLKRVIEQLRSLEKVARSD
jgi:hypothetical protein